MRQHFSIPPLFSRIARHLACVAFCILQVGIFCQSSIDSFEMLKAAANFPCQRILANAIVYCYKSIVCRLY